ncbi:hypothetical protein J6T21_01805 [Candidatus Saccharibacteria bacterium]|nr:hypothetical protein [Candidatus Saccharibacteria bacterium]
MDSEAYLNRISASNRKAKNSGGIFSSIWIKILIAVTAVVLIIILFSNLAAPTESVKDKLVSLKLHATNLSKTIGTYQPRVKSSILRSSTASLNSILVNTTSSLTNYIADQYKTKDDKSTPANIKKKEEKLTTALEEELFNARINGFLDRTFASKMAYEITVISTREKEILKLTKNDNLKDILNSSLNSLDTLYNSFNNYSDAR